MKDFPKIGVTEQGDPSYDYSWIEKLDQVSGTVLITKNIDSQKFREIVLKLHKAGHKFIVHITITGLGGTFVEPNVSPYSETIPALIDFVKEFPISQVVLRIDPIIPTEIGSIKALYVIDRVLEHLSGNSLRMRFSFIDQYKHLKERGLNLLWDSFNPPIDKQNTFISYLINNYKKSDLRIETCAESNISIPPDWKCGCVSPIDYILMGIEMPIDMKVMIGLNQKNIYKGQRKECLCIATKTELLSGKHQCPNKCIYCYWR